MLECAGQGEDIAYVIIDQEQFAPFEHLVATARRLEHALSFMGQRRLDFVQKQCHFIEQALR
ncbi:hypothetical protein D3C84_1290010 [compost metagenome]